MEENVPSQSTSNSTPEITPIKEPLSSEVIKPSKPWLKLAISFIVILLIGGGLVFAGMEMQKRQGNQPTPTTEAVATPTSDPTADWKTYTNSQYKIQFKYPSNSVLKKEMPNPQANQYSVIFEEPSFVLDIQDIRGNMTDNYLDFPIKETQTINSLSWQIATATNGYCDAGTCSSPFIVYQIFSEKTRFAFVFHNSTSKEEIQIKILSTFKFLE